MSDQPNAPIETPNSADSFIGTNAEAVLLQRASLDKHTRCPTCGAPTWLGEKFRHCAAIGCAWFVEAPDA